MQTFTDTLLSKFDSAIRQLGPVNTLIDKVVSRVAPTVEAKACSGYGCRIVACTSRSSQCYFEVAYVTYQMASQPWECANGPYYYCSGCGLYGVGSNCPS